MKQIILTACLFSCLNCLAKSVELDEVKRIAILNKAYVPKGAEQVKINHENGTYTVTYSYNGRTTSIKLKE